MWLRKGFCKIRAVWQLLEAAEIYLKLGVEVRGDSVLALEELGL